MTPFVTLNWNESPPETCRNGAVAVGNFDGVHLGHVSLIRTLCEQARSVKGPAAVVSFDPHPLKLLAPDKFQPVLTDTGDRANLLRQAGADQVVLLQTTIDLLELSPQDFFDVVLCSGFEARAIVEGFNFRFGHNRTGNVEMLKSVCEQNGILFQVVPSLQLDGLPVSSSRVRKALVEGNVRGAARLLGRPYSIRGVVGTGEQRGRQLGFPTANLEDVKTLLPGDGVYAVQAELACGSFLGAANIGPNPTFGERARKIEVHLLDFVGDLYGQELRVTFHERIRGTRKFASAAELAEQIQQDVAAVRRM
jgi:riboflavin kinase/FMN adenylyltransferase